MLDLILQSDSVEAVCQKLNISRLEFDKILKNYASERTPSYSGEISGAVKSQIEIFRDAYAIPHIYADNLYDLLFGLGFVMAQDRLWQMDVSRRMGLGRLSEIFGRETLDSDILARTVGLNRIAQRQEKNLKHQTKTQLQAFADGVNRSIEAFGDKLPFEFEIFSYNPEPWSVLDTLAIMRNLWWKLTGRLYVLAAPELAKRHLKSEKLYQAFLQPESSDETIIPEGSYPKNRPSSKRKKAVNNRGQNLGLPHENYGSNNWVISSKLSKSGAPILASDPHQPFSIPQTWYIAHICGSGLNACGITHPGVPGILMGRNENMSWGITNNICSLRDLFIEKINPENPGQYWNISAHPPRWDQVSSITEEIKIRGEKSVSKEVRFTHHGPIVNEILPDINSEEPVALSWVGMEESDEISAMIAINGAKSVKEFREALRGWSIPTFNVIFADKQGHIAYQCVGKIPIRGRPERGYRQGWKAEDQWTGYIPYDQMPHLINPQRGWIASANNQVAPDDYPYPLSGTWASDHRARRIRQILERKAKHSIDDFQDMQLDVVSLRAVELLPALIGHLEEGDSDPRLKDALKHLRAWDGSLDQKSVAASIFETFFAKWTERVAKERFPKDLVPMLLSPGLANNLLQVDDAGWFNRGKAKLKKHGEDGRVKAIREVFLDSLDFLAQKFGDKMSDWKWGKLHTITLRHPLAKKGCLAELFNSGPYPYRGGGTTVQNAGYDSNFKTTGGAEYRQIADLGDQSKLYVIGCMGQSGSPLTRHYDDQTKIWVEGGYLETTLYRPEVESSAKAKLKIKP